MTELMAYAGRKTTWKKLKALEPLLVVLEQQAATFRDASGMSFYNHLKGPLCKLVGWGREGGGDPVLKSPEAYDLAYETIYDLSARSKRLTTGAPKICGDSLVGRWFHSHDDEGRIGWQGQVLESQGKDIYLVQTYEWIVGGAYTEEVVPHSRMLDERWTFYDTPEAMQYAYRFATRDDGKGRVHIGPKAAVAA